MSCPTCGRPFNGSESKMVSPYQLLNDSVNQPSTGKLDKTTPRIPRLSAELLSRIFTSCVASLSTSNFPDVDYKNKTIGLALTLGSVCQNWRTVSLKTPQLWNTVHLSSDLPVEIAEIWLARSVPLPLDVQFHIPPEVNIQADEDEDAEEEEVEYITDVRSIITEINRHVSRWRSVHFSVHPEMLSWFSLSQKANQPQRLDVLSLCLYSEEGDEVEVELQGVVPSKLWIMGYIEEIGIQWNNLTHLAFRNTTVRKCYEALSVVRQVQFCSFDTMQDEDEFAMQHPLILPSLDTLHLEHYPNSFWDCFIFPSLQTLHVLPADPQLLVGVRSAIVRSKCQLKDLRILHQKETDQSEIIETLRLAPSLKKLHIRGCSISDTFFELMTALCKSIVGFRFFEA
ncbi:hypothetical protein CPB83DRAFT_911410 [Crepidotus variabilis]|uniref:F-box domain-containing protein n=1 Tax=Crepidotus variabilis TaxID=179855 RepID=A0A9P6E4C4_9AGAR|nr:hypothetical protein CPB83DRAFT_911410 [Crepidotus variabilis]